MLTNEIQDQLHLITSQFINRGITHCAFDFDQTLTPFHFGGEAQYEIQGYFRSHLQSKGTSYEEAENIANAIFSNKKEEIIQSIEQLQDVFFAHPKEVMTNLIDSLKSNGITVAIYSKNKNSSLLNAAAHVLKIDEDLIFQHTSPFKTKIQQIGKNGSVFKEINPSQCVLIDDDEMEGAMEEQENRPAFIHVNEENTLLDCIISYIDIEPKEQQTQALSTTLGLTFFSHEPHCSQLTTLSK